MADQLFPVTKETQLLTPDALFDGQISTRIDPAALVQRLNEKAADIASPFERLDMMLGEFTSHSQKPLPQIERFPVHYAEDGIVGFKLALHLRQLVAKEHWLGNT